MTDVVETPAETVVEVAGDLEVISVGEQGPPGAANIPVDVHAATSKATPVDADELALLDSASSFGLKKLTWANLKATTRAFFDTLYDPSGAASAVLAAAAAALAAHVAAADPHPQYEMRSATAFTPGGRLTLESGVPFSTSDQTGKSSIFYTPDVHNCIKLWDGSIWREITFTEYTLALGTLTSGRTYDVFAYLNNGALALEAVAWSSATAMFASGAYATTRPIVDGRKIKSTDGTAVDKTRLWLGTFYTTSTTTTENAVRRRYLYNAYNQRRHRCRVAYATQHTYSTNTTRQMSADTANQFEYVLGEPQDATVRVAITGSGTAAVVSAGLDSTTGENVAVNITTSTFEQLGNADEVTLAIGRHFWSLNERAGAGTSCTFCNFGIPCVAMTQLLM